MVEVGLYVTGWIKTGPVGVIDTTLKDSLVIKTLGLKIIFHVRKLL